MTGKLNLCKKPILTTVLVISLSAIILIALFVTLLVTCGIDTSTPEGTIKAYLKACESQNVAAEADFFTESVYYPFSREQYIAREESARKYYKSLSITNVRTTVESQDGNSARVVASYHVRLVNEVSGMAIESDMSIGHTLTKIDDKWLIADSWSVKQVSCL